MWETDWEELKKHPGYIPVDRGLRRPAEHRRHLEGHGRRALAAAQRPYRRDPGRQRRGLERQSLVGQDQERPHLRARLVRHEERRRQPHPGGRIPQGRRPEAQGRRLHQHRHRRGGQRPRHARHGDPRLQGGCRHFRRDQRPRGAAGLHRPHLVRDRNPRQAGRHPEALRGHERDRARQQDHQGGRRSSRPSASRPSSIRSIRMRSTRFPASSAASRPATIRARSRQPACSRAASARCRARTTKA